MNNKIQVAKPFLKWAGGKTQLLNQFSICFPKELYQNKIDYYYEPFLGSGAVFFYLNSKFKFRHSFLYDSNEHLITAFNVIKNYLDELIQNLRCLEKEYFETKEIDRELFYYQRRDDFNSLITIDKLKDNTEKKVKLSAYLIFLNRTCFNGLFRMNRKGEFNVPFGRYKNPQILNENNLRLVQKSLDNTTIKWKNFKDSLSNINSNSFVYLDPPYLPLNKTSSFTAYSKEDFTIDDQIELSIKFKELSKKKNIWMMLSNSDPKNENPLNNFFEKNYKEGLKNIYINRVSAKRMINCNAEKRGAINELIITNYKNETSNLFN